MTSSNSSSSSSSNNEIMWKSKMGTNYPMDFMKANEKKFFQQLQSLRQLPENRDCADCGAKGCTMWASVNLGVFLCITCGSHHRSLGTHISKPKGCTGTYWWGPDELENMKAIGNAHASQIYGDKIPAGLTPTTSNPVEWRKYLTDKYVDKKYAPPPRPSTSSSSTVPAATTSTRRSATSMDSNFYQLGSLPSPVKEDATATVTVAVANKNDNLMNFEQEAGHQQDFFSNFGTKKEKKKSTLVASTIIRNAPLPEKNNADVDLLGLFLDDSTANEEKKEASPPPHHQTRATTKTKNVLDFSNNNSFFAEFGL